MAFGALKGNLTGAANSITNPFAASGSVAVTPGDLVFGVFAEQTSLTVTGVFDNLGNSYTAAQTGTDAGNITGRAFYSTVTKGGTLTSVSGTCTGSTDNVVFVASVFEGPFTTAPLDANPALTTADITTPFACPSSGTLGQATELVVGWLSNTGVTATATAPNTLATSILSQTVVGVAIGYQTVSTTAAVTPNFTGTNPTQIVLGTNSFKRQANLNPWNPYSAVMNPLIAQ